MFQEFPKIGRWFRDIFVTEKLDGTNAQVLIVDPAQNPEAAPDDIEPLMEVSGLLIWAGSRDRFLSLGGDNYGFARWVVANAEGLALLGPGRHFGEWWGAGIQRRYGLEGGDKRFSLFAVHRWATDPNDLDLDRQLLPPVRGLGVVPILYQGSLIPPNKVDPIAEALRRLQYGGSVAAPGFDKPEGVIIWHTATRTYAKATLDGDAAKGS